MPDQKKNDEIDVTDLFIKIINVFKANFWAIVLFIAIGIALGTTYYFATRKIYQSQMIISSNILTEPFCMALFNNASRYIDEGNAKMLATQFHISEEVAQQIVSLEVQTVTKGTSTDPKGSERFLITAEVLDLKILPELQQGIIAYLESNDFVKTRVEQNKNFFKQMLARVEKEIADMEEFKIRIFKGDFFQNAKGNVMFDPTIVNSKILELTDKKITYQNSLEIANSVQLIDGFTRFEKQIRPKLSLSLTSGFLAGLGMALAFMLIRFVSKLTAEPKSLS